MVGEANVKRGFSIPPKGKLSYKIVPGRHDNHIVLAPDIWSSIFLDRSEIIFQIRELGSTARKVFRFGNDSRPVSEFLTLDVTSHDGHQIRLSWDSVFEQEISVLGVCAVRGHVNVYVRFRGEDTGCVTIKKSENKEI